MTTFTRFFVIRNPKSTNAHRAERQIAELRQLTPTPEVIVLETLPGGHRANRHLLHDYAGKLDEHTLVCIAAGDGTVNLVLELLLGDPDIPERAKQARILPLWGGNANDLAHMLNGTGLATSLTTLLQTARVLTVYPLVCRLTDTRGKTTTHLAASYIGFGASAFATEVLSKSVRKKNLLHKLPHGRLTEEALVILRAMRRASRFDIEMEGNRRRIFEYIFFNGTRFAKIVDVRQRLTERSFHYAIIEPRRLITVLYALFKMRRPAYASKYKSKHTRFTIISDTSAQLDGEAMPIPAGTTVEILPGDTPFHVLATRPKP